MVRTCSIWRALEVLGDVPTLLIFEAIWLGDVRFEPIRKRTCLSKPLVSDRLKALVANGVIERRLYNEHPPRHEFAITKKGQDLFPVTMMLLRWEKTWSAKREHLSIGLVHHDCGETTMPQPLCGHCGEVVRAQDLEWQEGPGLGWMQPDYTRRRQQRGAKAIAENLTLFTDAAELLGDRWAGLVMRAAFTGRNRFDAILADSAMASNILSDRLAWLVDKGFLKASLYQSKPNRFAYYPTAKALDYLPILLMLQMWGDRYYASEEGPPVILRHKICGHSLDLYAGCGGCKGRLATSNVSLTP